ncbi:hypothetical protein JGUZn3_14030 [Entomobacter blattae]|uniref:Uncharacterized protein n=1 Tax=Entomobacter blattae TaxID=2762277 RepID=A0A7H1NS68_9PROT|nr:hypothetical protein JGUZn3_14030 [Entomobacter blattae]
MELNELDVAGAGLDSDYPQVYSILLSLSSLEDSVLRKTLIVGFSSNVQKSHSKVMNGFPSLLKFP